MNYELFAKKNSKQINLLSCATKFKKQCQYCQNYSFYLLEKLFLCKATKQLANQQI